MEKRQQVLFPSPNQRLLPIRKQRLVGVGPHAVLLLMLMGTSSSSSRSGHEPAPLSDRDAEVGATKSDPPAAATIAPLIETISTYLSAEDIRRVKEAYRFSDESHLGQFRQSGEPYISHPIAVTEICASWKLDAPALMAAFLHDVMEDQGVSKDTLIEKFSPEVAELVDGLSKLDRLEFASKAEQQAESFRKMLLAMAQDVRVILIKLADRMHNMRTLGSVPPVKRRRVAKETLDIYAPIAHRLGLNLVYREFQELCFEAIYPHRYNVLRKAVMAARGNRRELVNKIKETVEAALPASGIQAEVQGREKTLFGIYGKMNEQKKSFSEVLDVYGFRVIVSTQPECYLAMGSLHQLYRPVPGKFKDYIAIPKVNGYQSLHTTLVGPYGTPVEFQIRTKDMNQVAETGVAAHWLYRTSDQHLNELQKRTHQWLQSLLDIQSQTGDSSEFLEHVKVDLFPDAVYVFTPRGRIISLPKGATPVDFAYSIHTDIGNRAAAAKINGELVPLRSELRSGDAIEIVTAEEARPNAQWLNFVRTGKARSEIRHFLRTVKYDESVAFGERLLGQALKALGADLPEAADPIWEKMAKGSSAKGREDILADIGLGKRLAAVVARRFLPDADPLLVTEAQANVLSESHDTQIRIQGNEGLAVQLAPCCNPIPGDAIIAYVRLGHGLVVHTEDCPTAAHQRQREPERWIDVAWDEQTSKHFTVRIDVITRQERGVLGRIAAEISAADANITHVSMQDEASSTVPVHFTIQVESRQHLAQVIRYVRRVPQVQRVVRVKS